MLFHSLLTFEWDYCNNLMVILLLLHLSCIEVKFSKIMNMACKFVQHLFPIKTVLLYKLLEIV